MATKKKKEIKTSVSEKKKKELERIIKLIEDNNSVTFASIKNLPSKQFQEIKKDIRDRGVVKVIKKSIISRAIDAVEKEGIKKLKDHIREDIAIIFSQLDPFEISAILSEKRNPIKAKIGQIAEEDIEIHPGPTEFTPGPVISEFGAMGIKIAIEDGKINIKEKKTILKKGDKVDNKAASLMAKLDIKPFYVGLEPLVAYDKKEDKVYVDIKVDKAKTLQDVKNAFGRAVAFAVSIGYYCKETVVHMLRKAFVQKRTLEKLIKEPSANQPEEKPVEENKTEVKNDTPNQGENKTETK